MGKKLFLSIVSNEFKAYRELLAGDLKRPNLDIATQEEFIVSGGSTLVKLDTYVKNCDGVIHLLGHATGSVPDEPAVDALRALYADLATRLPVLADSLKLPQPGFSYTQWEAYLALYHKRPLFIYRPTDFDEVTALNVPRGADFKFSDAQAQSQREHYERICALGHDRGQFTCEERLSSAVLRDLVEILPRLESSTSVSPTRLPAATQLLVGRDEDLSDLDIAWKDPHKNVVVVRAFGGMGKTSLISTWMAILAHHGWREAEQVFDWSFYSQGTRDQSHASADLFIDAALRAFGDLDPTLGSAWDRGARLANLVGAKRCLLVLDGLEPLQHPPGPMHGKLKDPGIEALLKGLAAHNAGLCVVTTRERVPDIEQHYDRTAQEVNLQALTDLAGAALLHHRGANKAGAQSIAPDDAELQATSRQVRGHGLTLQLLGSYLRLAEHGDILKRDTVRLADADQEYSNDATRPYGHAFKAMEAYEQWFASDGAQGQRLLAILRLLSLFDRTASKGCLNALRAKPAIPGLTDPLVPLTPRDWNRAISRLGDIDLVTASDNGSLECHALLREYFAMRLKASNDKTWREAQHRLFDYLCATTKEGTKPTLHDLEPLYQAVVHGCQAGLQQQACDEVYFLRIQRGEEYFSKRKLGAFGSDLGAIACFFESPWSRLSPALMEGAQAWLLNEAAFTLRALGRLTEALEPLRTGLEMGVKAHEWLPTSNRASNLSGMELALGGVAAAVTDAEQSVTYAERSRDAFQRMGTRTVHADALHQWGRRAEAEGIFREAEVMQKDRQPNYPLLYGSAGFWYCDLLLAEAERAAWKGVLHRDRQHAGLNDAPTPRGHFLKSTTALFRTITDRATQTLKWAEDNNISLLNLAIDHLTLARVALYGSILNQPDIPNPQPSGATHVAADCSEETGGGRGQSEINLAVSGLRQAGMLDKLPLGLLTRSLHRALNGSYTGPYSAQSDLDEAWEIAERGSMKLFIVDIHLHRARLFFREPAYPWKSPQHDLAEARRLIAETGYHRRDEELADAEAVIGRADG